METDFKEDTSALKSALLSIFHMDYQVNGISAGKIHAIALLVLLVGVSYFGIFYLSLLFTSNSTVSQIIAYLITAGIVLLVYALRGRKKGESV